MLEVIEIPSGFNCCKVITFMQVMYNQTKGNLSTICHLICVLRKELSVALENRIILALNSWMRSIDREGDQLQAFVTAIAKRT